MKIKKLIGLLGLTSSLFLTSCGVGPAVKELKKINDENARYWAEFIKKNGINAIDYENDTVLLYALDTNNTDLVKACIKCGADVNLTRKQPPLIVYPVLRKDTELVNLFLKKGAVVIGKDYYQDSLKYIAEGFSPYNPCDENAKKIIDLLFTKVTLTDINRIAEYTNCYFEDYSSSSNKQAVEKIYDNITAKGYKLTKKDIFRICEFLPKEKLNDLIIANLDILDLHFAFEVLAGFDKYRTDGSNENKYEIFKSILQSVEINESNYSDIKDEFNRLYWLATGVDEGYDNISNLLDKVKEIAGILKEKNFNIQDCIICFDYDLQKKLESIPFLENNVEYWREGSSKDKTYLDMLESSEKDLANVVDQIKNKQLFQVINYLVSEGFPLVGDSKELYENFVNKYGKN